MRKTRVSYISYLSALSFAEHSIHLTNAYFIPDRTTLEALAKAARRGVDVKIIVPPGHRLEAGALRHALQLCGAP